MTPEQAITAAENTLDAMYGLFCSRVVIEEVTPKQHEEPLHDYQTTIEHCTWMVQTMRNELLPNEKHAKIMRWLGWMQGVACSYGVPLRTVKYINMEASYD